MERRTALNTQTIIGLNQKLVDRLSPIAFPKVETHPDEFIEISWDRGKGFQGGLITLQLADNIGMDGTENQGKNNMVLSFIDVKINYDPHHDCTIRNPRESLVAFLTLIATLNDCALMKGAPILHVARASNKSSAYFEKFFSSGLYFYCDRFGKRTTNPKIIKDWTLYGCLFPASGLENLLSRFIIKEASERFMKIYNQKESLIRLFISGILTR